MTNLNKKVEATEIELLKTERDTARLTAKIYKDAFHASVKEVERAEQRNIQLTNQLAENRQQFLNLLKLLRTKYGLTSAELGEEIVYGMFKPNKSIKDMITEYKPEVEMEFDEKELDKLDI